MFIEYFYLQTKVGFCNARYSVTCPAEGNNRGLEKYKENGLLDSGV
jgi:hypothetical protein